MFFIRWAMKESPFQPPVPRCPKSETVCLIIPANPDSYMPILPTAYSIYLNAQLCMYACSLPSNTKLCIHYIQAPFSVQTQTNLSEIYLSVCSNKYSYNLCVCMSQFSRFSMCVLSRTSSMLSIHISNMPIILNKVKFEKCFVRQIIEKNKMNNSNSVTSVRASFL